MARKAPSIKTSEYQKRRAKVLKSLKDSVGIIFAGDGGGELTSKWRPDPNFEYLTGITDEPGAAIVFDPTHPVPAKQVVLFLKPLDPEVEKWDGARDFIDSAMVKKYGIQTIFRTSRIPLVMRIAAQKSRKLACLHQFAHHEAPVSPDLAVFQKVCQRIPGVSIVDRTELLAKMRSIKSGAERDCMKEAVRISALGYDEVLRTMKPGMTEFDIQETLEHAYRANGSRGPAYNTIAGSGFNGTVLHYGANDQVMKDGDLIVIDSGADYRGYAADVTRTYPVNGRFTKRQKEIYSIVLMALEASIRKVKAGCTFEQIDKASRDIIKKAGYGDYFIHGIGHHLGIEVHDITPQGPLKEGAVITIEPGIYIPDENLGVRIEDDIVVTKTGHINLSRSIPKSIAAIEKSMNA
ncbi:MAG: Xaa-Pro peptidase family protein [Phycisphaerales bacterium]|nr:Xaa-Pro peptidase family protein [Phycisphaerales bacterium]